MKKNKKEVRETKGEREEMGMQIERFYYGVATISRLLKIIGLL